MEEDAPPKGVSLLGGVALLNRCGLVEGSMSQQEVGFENSSAQASLLMTLSPLPVAYTSRCSQRHVCLHATLLCDMMIKDWPTETVREPPQ